MLIREDVVTTATPERAWELIHDPSLHDLWNPRIVRTEILGGGAAGVGFRYRVTYEMSGRQSELDAEITEFSPPCRYVARLEERVKGDGRHAERWMEERYLVTRHGRGTRVRHEVRIHRSGVNLFLRILIRLLMRTGRPTGQPFMERFCELAEERAPGTAARSA
jgi:uncharacterized protein YndB with AHSA1/START domain